MKYTLAINMCYFSSMHLGGKDETAFNLLRGFEKNGVSKNTICLCAKNMVDTIKQYAPSVHICIVPQLYFNGIKIKGMNFVNQIIRNQFEKRWVEKNKENIGVFLYPNKPTAPWKYEIPTVVIPHDIQVFENRRLPGIEYPDKEYNKWTASIIQDFKNRDHVIAISDFDKNAMIQYMPWAESKIKRIYDPIYFEKMGDDFEKGNEYLTVLNIQWKHKNVETVIRAFALIANQISQSLILVGKVPNDIDYLQKLVADLGISDRVIFTGFVSTQELDEIVKKTRIYINASYYEGFGMTAIEMMGRKIPTIVARNTAMPEVTRGLCYYYEPTDDSHSLAQVILQELQNPQSPETLDAIAAEVKEAYSYDAIAKQYWNFLLGCTKGNSYTGANVDV